jgi:hypothetical protein
MGWYRRGNQRYYFRSVRDGESVKKIYFGSGPAADLAARADRLKQHEKLESQKAWQSQKEQIENAENSFVELDRGGDLVLAAVLLTSGFHRPDRRQAWRGWRDGQRVLKRSDT